jgi:hypothetical protein
MPIRPSPGDHPGRDRLAVAARLRRLTVTVFLNMYAALTNPFYNNPGISDWLGIRANPREWGVTFPSYAVGERCHLTCGRWRKSGRRHWRG